MSAKPCGKILDVGITAPSGMQVEAIAWRVKKSLLLHWLTCGIYSTRQSGGTQGFWKGVRENFASFVGYPEPEPSPNLGEPPAAFTNPLAPVGGLWFQSLKQHGVGIRFLFCLGHLFTLKAPGTDDMGEWPRGCTFSTARV